MFGKWTKMCMYIGLIVAGLAASNAPLVVSGVTQVMQEAAQIRQASEVE